MLNRIASRFSRVVEKYLPDAFVIAVLMTLGVFIIGTMMNPSEPAKLIKSFGDGFWVYLPFTMQMILLLMTGMTLAAVPVIQRLLESVAAKAKTANQAYVLTFLVSAAAYYINWGLAVVVGSIVAREVGKRNPDAHFPLLVASAYTPTVLYTAGLSSTIGLTVATKGHFLEDIMGVIPTSQTIFHPGTIAILVALLVTIPIFIMMMAPKKEIIPYKAPLRKQGDEASIDSLPDTPAGRLERAPFLGIITGLIGAVYVLLEFTNGRDLDLNIINLTFLSLGLILHKSLYGYANAFKESAAAISPIILQFPFYAGIIGMLGSSGLGASIVNGITSVASKDTFDIFTYWAAGLVNILAPSGGGQWALQGPLQVPAGIELGVDPGVTAMAVGWGDAWTNLIQPFWALPILAVARLHIRHIMGYCMLLSIWVGLVTTILMLFVY